MKTEDSQTYANDLVSISDFADFASVNQSLLRHYDEIGLFKPVARGDNNYRYYSTAQLQTIKLITTLRTLRVPLKDIADFIEQRSPETAVETLNRYEIQLSEELNTVKRCYAIVTVLRKMIEAANVSNIDEVSILFHEDLPISLGPVNEFRADDQGHLRVWSEFFQKAAGLHIDMNFPIGAYFQKLQGFVDHPHQPERFFSLDPAGFERLRAGYYLTGYSRGDYGQMEDLPERMAAKASELKLRRLGPIYQIYLYNEVCQADPKDYLVKTLIYLPNYTGGTK